MKKVKLSIAALVAMGAFATAGGDLVPAPVVDNSGFYVGAGIASVGFAYDDDWGFDNIDIRFSVYGINLIAGYQFNQYIAVEGRYSMNIEDWGQHDDFDATTLSIFAKPMYAVNDVLTIYGLLGYGQLKFSGSGKNDESDTSFQWGVGASAAITDKVSAFIDYTRYWDGDNFDNSGNEDFIYDAVTVGAVYKF